MRTLNEFLTDEDRVAIRAPISEARTFPQIAYRSQEFFEFEVTHLFTHNWVAVGFAGSLAQVGDVAPLEIIRYPTSDYAGGRQGDFGSFIILALMTVARSHRRDNLR